MITGKITANREAIIELEVIGSNQKREKVEAVIDTGFNCYSNSFSPVGAVSVYQRVVKRLKPA